MSTSRISAAAAAAASALAMTADYPREAVLRAADWDRTRVPTEPEHAVGDVSEGDRTRVVVAIEDGETTIATAPLEAGTPWDEVRWEDLAGMGRERVRGAE